MTQADLSRLGRNYIESGSYIEIFFPQHDVRYIAVNDGVDSINTAEMDITPFKNILNEMYSRDISKKIRSGKLVRAQQGKFMGVTAPFGLKKDPADKNHLIIDEETAPTVRFIYDLALKGYGTLRINKQLEAKGYPRPAYYKPEYFDMRDRHPERIYRWDEETVTRILRNPVYKGYMWVNHTSKKSLKQKDRGYIRISAQLIFCDLSTPKGDGTFNVYEDIRDKLMAKGVPKEEIAFIHDANTELRKAELFAKVRSGQVRFLFCWKSFPCRRCRAHYRTLTYWNMS